MTHYNIWLLNDLHVFRSTVYNFQHYDTPETLQSVNREITPVEKLTVQFVKIYTNKKSFNSVVWKMFFASGHFCKTFKEIYSTMCVITKARI